MTGVFVITMLAGLSTVLGAVFVNRVRNTNIGAFSLAFATGIMLSIAIGELLPESTECIGFAKTLIFFVVGASLSLVLDVLFPHHHDHEAEEAPGHYINDCACIHEDTISHGMIMALVLHNVIEGLAMGIAVKASQRIGINMAIGIAIHNIPIGTTLAVSLLSAGKTKKQAVLSSAFVGFSQTVSAVLGAVALNLSIEFGTLLAFCNAVVSGILVFVAFDELWPAARKSGSRNLTIFALLIGICFTNIIEAV